MHDRNGTPLQVGDIVVVKGRISATYATDTYCNVTLDVGYGAAHGPHNVTGHLTLNTKQTLLVEKAAPAPDDRGVDEIGGGIPDVADAGTPSGDPTSDGE